MKHSHLLILIAALVLSMGAVTAEAETVDGPFIAVDTGPVVNIAPDILTHLRSNTLAVAGSAVAYEFDIDNDQMFHVEHARLHEPYTAPASVATLDSLTESLYSQSAALTRPLTGPTPEVVCPMLCPAYSASAMSVTTAPAPRFVRRV